tara:strand:- start:338 stop:529 length:192 start_codon:yes stop_codon:yes gene_type:complete
MLKGRAVMTRLFFMLRVIFLLLIFSIIEGFAKASQLTTLSKVDVKKTPLISLRRFWFFWCLVF